MAYVRWDERPSLTRPVLIAAFEGWNDAAEAATTAARYLRDRWGARPFASVDPEEFYDFSSTRPEVRIEGFARRIVWPATELSSTTSPAGPGRDVVVLVGSEPQLKWRTFCGELVKVAVELDVELMVTLGALLADVAHTRPVKITGSAVDTELVKKLGLRRSQYEGPTGIVGVLHDALATANVPSASLWAAVPHYVAATPSPKAALALVERTARLINVPVVTADLAQLAADYERQVSEVVAADEDVSAYVARLEENADNEGLEMTSGEDLAAELQRFLRERGDG
jgi:proteasome assembly chaperone (PAC2) family protein